MTEYQMIRKRMTERSERRWLGMPETRKEHDDMQPPVWMKDELNAAPKRYLFEVIAEGREQEELAQEYEAWATGELSEISDEAMKFGSAKARANDA